MVIILKSGRGVVVFNVGSEIEKNSATCIYKVCVEKCCHTQEKM